MKKKPELRLIWKNWLRYIALPLIIIPSFFLVNAQDAVTQDNLFDAKLAQNAVAVVRAKLIFAADLHKDSMEKFTNYAVHTIHVFKNDSTTVIRDINVLAYKGKPGIPPSECTIYLKRYDTVNDEFSDNKDRGIWILVGGDATNGVSNIATE